MGNAHTPAPKTGMWSVNWRFALVGLFLGWLMVISGNASVGAALIAAIVAAVPAAQLARAASLMNGTASHPQIAPLTWFISGMTAAVTVAKIGPVSKCLAKWFALS